MALLALTISFLVYWVVILVSFFRARKDPNAVCYGYTGGLGQGKSLKGVNAAIRALRLRRILWALGCLKSVEELDLLSGHSLIPQLYSNIPIYYKNSLIVRILALYHMIDLPKYEFAKKLRYEHITRLARIVEYSVLFLDELGDFADQYSFDNPVIRQYFEKFIRHARHERDVIIIWTDQSSSNISKPIRLRTNTIYNLHDFRRFMLWFYKVSVDEVILTEDLVTTKNSNEVDEQYFIGYLPFKYFKFLDISRLFTYKKYDSRCFSIMYNEVKTWLDDDIDWSTYKTDYKLELPSNARMFKQFKRDGYIPLKDMMKYIDEWKVGISTTYVDTSGDNSIEVQDRIFD